MVIYAFDVDDTLEISGGPIPLVALADLRAAGHAVGICGNFAVFCARAPQWHTLVCFLGPGIMSKPDFLVYMKTYCPADEYVVIGNDPRVFGASDDRGAAEAAGWRFISERAFAEGMR